jgi:hypothetical protein
MMTAGRGRGREGGREGGRDERSVQSERIDIREEQAGETGPIFQSMKRGVEIEERHRDRA